MVDLKSISEKGEIWKPAVCPKHTEEIAKRYLASNHGRIFSINRHQIVKGRTNNRDDYLKVNFYVGNNQSYNIFVHRIIALTFIENDDPVNKVNVDHINGDKADNTVTNLRWVTRSFNSIMGKSLNVVTGKRRICKFDLDLNFVQLFDSITDAIDSMKLGKNYLEINSFMYKCGGYWFYYDYIKKYYPSLFNKINNKSIEKTERICFYHIEENIIIKVFKNINNVFNYLDIDIIDKKMKFIDRLPKIKGYDWRYILKDEKIDKNELNNKRFNKIMRKNGYLE